ncbi:MAG: M3 family metallopeptidase [Candidatus Sifarchaeia archaeon]
MGEKSELPRWDLSPLIESEDPDNIKKSMDECLGRAEVFEEKYKGRISDLSPSEVSDTYSQLDNLRMNWDHLRNYSWLRLTQNVENKTANDIFDYAVQLDTKIRSKLVFFEIEIARALMDRPEIISNSSIDQYRHALEKARNKGEYLLSEQDESLIIEKDLYGIDTWSILHQKLKSTRKYKVVIKDEEKDMGFTEIMSIAEGSPNRESRKAAAEAFYDGVSRDKLVYSSALKCVFGDHLLQVKLRNYPSVLTQSLLANDISQDILDALIDSMKNNTHLIRRFLKLRAKIMGLSKLTGYDISPGRAAPFVESQSNFTWSETKRLIVESFADFDNEAGRFVSDLFERGRIDAGSRPGKSGQAFCTSFPELRTSYILARDIGNISAIATLAHECGHGLHGYYRSEKHKWINFISGSCMAETGSTFGEMLLVDKLLKESDDEETKIAVLDRVLCGLYVSIFYILNDYLFESSVYRAMEKNEVIDGDRLDSLWKKARTEVFGDSVDWIQGQEQCWVIPVQHFMPRYRFYNYPYAFGQLLVFVLYHLYKEEGSSFVPKMKRILSAGGSESPKTLLAEVELDLNDPEFWEVGFKLALTYLDEFEKIVKNRE